MDGFAYSSESEQDSDRKDTEIRVNIAPVASMQVSKNEQLTQTIETSGASMPKMQRMNVPDFDFKREYYTFQNFGYATKPNLRGTPELAVSDDARLDHGFRSVYQKQPKDKRQEAQWIKKERLTDNDPSSPNFNGPWAPLEVQKLLEETKVKEIDEEQKSKLVILEERRKKKLKEHKDNPLVTDYVSSEIILKDAEVTFHGASRVDYQGRSFIHPPTELKIDPNQPAYLPKKCIHTYVGHTKAIQTVKFIPIYGHLLLTGSIDHTVKIWDVFNNRHCVQTYAGHTNAIRDICWNYDGTEFLTCSYDRLIRQWDTETGKVINTFKCRKIPYCIRYNPDPERQSAFIVGTANRVIQQYDTNSGKKVLKYEEHLGSVYSICFVDGNKKFVSSSDDKKLFLWEFGIPVVVKHISEPAMNIITYMQLHPNERHFVGQSVDNRLVVMEARGGFRLNRRKKFIGHINSGYSCAITFSPDGQFIGSGDSNGRAWFWDWRTSRNYRTLQGHEDACVGLDYHPIIPSMVATCGWDGVAKLWD
jgi:pre-mRNA-processing factor 17